MSIGIAPFSLLEDYALWYKDAIIYQLHVRAFYDSDGDGIGDFQGLTMKLDYLKDLGVTAIWLLPFYPSPLKDDGYDIADYMGVHPSYGTLQDFRHFIREAHKRGIRVITELVLNHTSDQHSWFQRARNEPPNSDWRNFYVWSDTPSRYGVARIIFKDYEKSNWTWDPDAKAYYWHRFYSHQPDLNFDNPEVRQAIFKVVDFWLDMEVDGLRLDAVPYLYERDGTDCENLPETHELLKELRSHIDKRFKNRMLLAEANQWPEDVAAYFGQGDECHMAFHFPLMPRMFMALRMEDSYPILEILKQMPPIPQGGQWALFLRNHDELTLEMFTDEERDYMYRVYARDHQARINLGIRRRLSPLLNNDRRKIELMNALLFSMAGTPIIYYGDEISMGDNIYLGDRNGVRTPMQWSAQNNAGFSKANPQQLYLPVIIDHEYHYEAVNVEIRQKNPDSLLWWMKRLIALRKHFKAFGRGSLEFLHSDNRKVLAFLRRYREEILLVVANLSREAQYVHLNLKEFTGRSPLEAFGGERFPPIEAKPYILMLGPYAFYWFSLEPIPAEKSPLTPTPAVITVPTLTVKKRWENLLMGYEKRFLEGVLYSYLRESRWFGGKAKKIESMALTDLVSLSLDLSFAYLSIFNVEYVGEEPDTYVIPLTFASGEQAEQIKERDPNAIVAHLELIVDSSKMIKGVLYDALSDRRFSTDLLSAILEHRHFRGEAGHVIAYPTKALNKHYQLSKNKLEGVLLKAEQSNTSIVYGDRAILKVFRRLGEGVNPDLEIGLFLTEKASFPNIPPVIGALEYRPVKSGKSNTLAILFGYIQNQTDAWHYTLDHLKRYLEHALVHPQDQIPTLPTKSLLALTQDEPPPLIQESVGDYLISADLLGRRTGELHLALATPTEDPAFIPEPFTPFYQKAIYHGMVSFTTRTLQTLRSSLTTLPPNVIDLAQKVLSREQDIIKSFKPLRDQKLSGMRIRVHGDYHLGQVLYTGKDFVIIDFEGEPARPLSERRLKRSPLRDVVGMIRSFHYASYSALGHASIAFSPEHMQVMERWTKLWYIWVSATFLKAYLDTVSSSSLMPQSNEEKEVILRAYLMEKAIYEVRYELNNRPDWVKIPLEGIFQLLETKI